MAFATALREIADLAPAPTFAQFRQDIDPAWIADALAAPGTAAVRWRHVPAEQAV